MIQPEPESENINVKVVVIQKLSAIQSRAKQDLVLHHQVDHLIEVAVEAVTAEAVDHLMAVEVLAVEDQEADGKFNIKK